MSPTTRKRNRHDYVPRVVEAVKVLTKGNGHGASRQTIVKYVKGRLNKVGRNGVCKLSSQMVNSGIRGALDSGLIVHSSGVGLNGSFVIPEKSTNGSTGTCHDKQKRIITKEAKLRNLSSLASGVTSTAERPHLENTVKTVMTKQRRSSKILVPFTDVETVHQDQLESGQKSNALKAILKIPTKDKFAAKRRQKGSSRKVKFCSPPSVFLISPGIKRRSKRKK